MNELTIDQACRAVGGKLLHGSGRLRVTSISTDSRTVGQDELFFALHGDNFDGHAFVLDALANGAVGAVVDRDYQVPRQELHRYPQAVILAVDDTLRSLGDLARHYRSTLKVRVIGVTGSNGKTTTKGMIHHILSAQMECLCSEASFNNAIGVPLTVFKIEERHGAAILELGTNHPGEIEHLAGIARPNVAVITNVSATHLEGLATIEGVADEKAAIIRALAPDGMAIFNRDDEWSQRIEKTWKGASLGFSIRNSAEVKASAVRSDESSISFACAGMRFVLPALGEHNVYNALAAAATARAVGVDWEVIRDRLETFELPAMRMERVSLGGVELINDAYNANPESMAAALRTLAAQPCYGRRIFVIGDMKELGEKTREYHRVLGRTVAGAGIDVLWTVGPASLEAIDAAASAGMTRDRLLASPDAADAAAKLPLYVQPGDVVLVKGSRANKMEAIVSAMRELLRIRPAVGRIELLPDDETLPATVPVERREQRGRAERA